MEAIINGVKITLTKTQVNAIQKVQNEREKCRNSFKRMLKSFGFKQMKGQPESFEHKVKNWYAEIHTMSNYDVVWMTGKGLKSTSAMPDG